MAVREILKYLCFWGWSKTVGRVCSFHKQEVKLPIPSWIIKQLDNCSTENRAGLNLLVMCFINALNLTLNLEINVYFIIFLWGVLLFTIDLTGTKGLPLTRLSGWHFADEILKFKKWINHCQDWWLDHFLHQNWCTYN